MLHDLPNTIEYIDGVIYGDPIEIEAFLKSTFDDVSVEYGVGHKDFQVIASHDIPVEVEMKRRDFTINAIAVKLDGTIIDPFDGQKDLKDGIIKQVDEVAFTDDPLRMLRAVQFASRFKFTIEPITFAAIQAKASTIKHITPERILIELEKIQTKGDVETGFKLLTKTGLFEQIFGFLTNFSDVAFDLIQSRGDFFFTLLRHFPDKSKAFKTILKGDVETAKTLEAIQFGFDEASLFVKECRMVAFTMFKMSKASFDSGILPTSLMIAISELKKGMFPKTLGELAVSGDDLIAMGFKQGHDIGFTLGKMLHAVLSGETPNTKDDLLKLL